MKKTIALINQLFINVFQNTMKTVMFFFLIYIKFVNNIHFLIANIQRNILQYIKINDTQMGRKEINNLIKFRAHFGHEGTEICVLI